MNRLETLDSLTKIIQNRLIGVGTPHDKFLHSEVTVVRELSYQELTNLYRGSDLCARVIDVPADLMTTTWINVEMAESEDNGAEILDKLRGYEAKLGVRAAFNKAAKLAFLYGKSYIILGIDDGKPLHHPVQPKSIRSVLFLCPLEMTDVRLYMADQSSVKPEFYEVIVPFNALDQPLPDQEITPYKTFLVHKSRILEFENTSNLSHKNQQHPTSKLQRFFAPFLEYYLAWNAIAAMLVDYDMYVHSYQGLVELLAQNGEEKLRRHMEDLHLMRSNLKMLLIDGNFEDGKFLNRNVGGIDKVVEKLEQRLTLAADMPYMYFWGQVGRAGMGDSGDAERALMQQKILYYQESMFRYNIHVLYSYIFSAKDGPSKGAVPSRWSFDFHPITILNPVQEAEIRHKDALTVEKLIRNNVITPGEARSLNAGNHYSSDITLHSSVRPIYQYIGDLKDPFHQEPNANRNSEQEYERKKENIELGKKENLDAMRHIVVAGYSFPIYHEVGDYIDYVSIQCPRSYLGNVPVLFGPFPSFAYGYEAQDDERVVLGFGFNDKDSFRFVVEEELGFSPSLIKKMLAEEVIKRWK